MPTTDTTLEFDSYLECVEHVADQLEANDAKFNRDKFVSDVMVNSGYKMRPHFVAGDDEDEREFAAKRKPRSSNGRKTEKEKDPKNWQYE
jgi:hypothetical protein